MGLRNLLVRMGKIFPDPVSMDDIRRMRRRELTQEEREKPYARYFHKELAEVPAEDLARVNAGPVDPALATSIYDRDDLMKPGYLAVETGYTVMPDGSGFAATLVRMPGVTPEMLDWWFNWHPLEGLRYALWCPVAHADIGVKDPARHLDSSGIPLEERNYGATHYPVEGFNLASAQRIAIEFFSPRDFGLDMSMFREPEIARAYCANVVLDLLKTPFNVFFHAVREVEGEIVEGAEAVEVPEDGFEVARYGERTLSKYRQMMRDQTGPSCPTGINPPGDNLLAQVTQDWLNEFERVQWLLRLSPRLRQNRSSTMPPAESGIRGGRRGVSSTRQAPRAWAWSPSVEA